MLKHVEGQVSSDGIAVTGLGKVGVAVVLVFLVGVGGYWVFQQLQKSQVPPLVGVSRAEAEKQLTRAHLVLGGFREEESGEPKGTVLRTEPGIGSNLAYGTGVTLVLAKPVEQPAPQIGIAQLKAGTAGLPQLPGRGAGPHVDVRVIPAPAGPVSRRTLPPATRPIGTSPPESSQPPVPPVPEVWLDEGSAETAPESPDCQSGLLTVVTQRVSMSGPGALTFQWVGSDGTTTPAETREIGAASTTVVRGEWRRTGLPGDTLTGWRRLAILSPKQLTGDPLTDDHVCPQPAT
ncbi:PASTA domain-containing protein [Actinoplanes sp. L3-i22]|uniref:PASTA domain-containing protein n=1 Tax=Actinoplanes sp. L3-i22 TaxID=2836373 RepID=UPI001C77EF09|nr:PASTA domain-containing protein [Actinoplanes sp. L3-i22]BCY08475.1 hypothetical protein L3i22_035630 [Actinoplanes sp. L3-i22]